MSADTEQGADEKMTVSEMIESLTGYEELAITKAFGASIFTLLESEYSMAGRALVFVLRKREGLDHAKAKDVAMELPFREVDAQFADEVIELDPDEPETPVGEGSDSAD